MKKIYYFPHEYNASNDPKCDCLISKFGYFGYGLFWKIVELLHQSKDLKLERKQYIYESLAMRSQATASEVQDALEYCFEVELFVTDGHYFWSDRVLRNIEEQKSISEKNRANAKKMWENRKRPQATASDTKRPHTIKENKIKENKIKYINNNESEKFKKPTLKDLEDYCKLQGYNIDCNYFLAYYESRGWMLGNSKIKSWKRALTMWWIRQNKEQKEKDNNTEVYNRRLL